jgi:hypothetical protein
MKRAKRDEAMSENTQWEYRIETVGSAFKGVKPEKLEIYLNEMGLDGWEVVSLHQPHSGSKVWITIKRPLRRSSRRRRTQPGDQW